MSLALRSPGEAWLRADCSRADGAFLLGVVALPWQRALDVDEGQPAELTEDRMRAA
jgi:hypothetical protein